MSRFVVRAARMAKRDRRLSWRRMAGRHGVPEQAAMADKPASWFLKGYGECENLSCMICA